MPGFMLDQPGMMPVTGERLLKLPGKDGRDENGLERFLRHGRGKLRHEADEKHRVVGKDTDDAEGAATKVSSFFSSLSARSSALFRPKWHSLEPYMQLEGALSFRVQQTLFVVFSFVGQGVL
ncbi:hypothetical protein MTO96_019965 [Rhipicephalus appendiculatus]